MTASNFEQHYPQNLSKQTSLETRTRCQLTTLPINPYPSLGFIVIQNNLPKTSLWFVCMNSYYSECHSTIYKYAKDFLLFQSFRIPLSTINRPFFTDSLHICSVTQCIQSTNNSYVEEYILVAVQSIPSANAGHERLSLTASYAIMKYSTDNNSHWFTLPLHTYVHIRASLNFKKQILLVFCCIIIAGKVWWWWENPVIFFFSFSSSFADATFLPFQS